MNISFVKNISVNIHLNNTTEYVFYFYILH